MNKNIVGYVWSLPEKPTKPGFCRVVCAFRTRRGETYYVGDKIELIEKTDEYPYGLLSSLGNWKVKGKDGEVTVWSSIDAMLAEKIYLEECV